MALGGTDLKRQAVKASNHKRPYCIICAVLCACVLMGCAAEPAQEPTDGYDPGFQYGVSYVTDGCSYMSMLSSTISIDGDSGYRYYFMEDSFIMEWKETGARTTIENVKWAWDKFPYDNEKWSEMRILGSGSPAFPGPPYGNNQYLDLGDGYFLIKNESGLSIARSYTERNGLEYIWSIYHLTTTQ